MHVLVGLHVVNHAANVRVELFLNGQYDGVGEVQPFAVADFLDEVNNVLNRQLVEAKADKFGLKRFVNAADVIAYEAKANVVLRVVVAVEQVTQRGLRVFGHVIHFIQDDKFDARSKEGLRGNEAVNLIANDVNAAFVGGVQVYHKAAVNVLHGGLLIFVDQIGDGGGFAGAGWAVKQQVWEVPGCNDVLQYEFIKGI